MSFQQLPTFNHDSMLVEIVGDFHEDNSKWPEIILAFLFLSSWLSLFEKAKTLQNSRWCEVQ